MDKHELDKWYNKEYKTLYNDLKIHPGSIATEMNMKNLEDNYKNAAKFINEKNEKEEEYRL